MKFSSECLQFNVDACCSRFNRDNLTKPWLGYWPEMAVVVSGDRDSVKNTRRFDALPAVLNLVQASGNYISLIRRQRQGKTGPFD